MKATLPIRREKPALSAGWRPSWSSQKPTLAANPHDLDDRTPVSLGQKYGATIISATAILLTVLSVVFVGVWTIVISTISATPRIDNNFLLIQRSAWVQGQGNIGQIAFAVPDAADGPGARIIEAVTGYQGGIVVELAAQPGQDRSVSAEGRLVVDNLDLGITTQTPLPGTIDDYLAVCLSGACARGELMAVPVADIVGEVAGVLGSDGFQDLTRQQP